MQVEHRWSWVAWLSLEKGALMAFPGDRTFLIGPFLDWWAQHVARRDAKRAKSHDKAKGTSARDR